MAASLVCLIGKIHGQGLPQVLTMNSGLQFEGELASVPAIVEGSSVFAEYDSQQIVRINDGMRFVFVSKNRAANIGGSSRNEIEIPIFQRPFPGGQGMGGLVGLGPFNEKGHRELVIKIPGIDDPVTYVQGITKITPRYCEVRTLVGADIIPKQWTMKIGTGTVPIRVLRSLLRTQIGDSENSSEYLKVAEFFLQAQQFNQAIEELRFIQKRFPDLQERLNDDRTLIRQAYAKQVLREVRLRLDAGQTDLATSFANAFNKEGLAGETLAEFREINTNVSLAKSALDETRTRVNELINSTRNVDDKQTAAIKRLKNEIETDLNTVNAPRLDAFLRLADDQTMPPQQKLSLAISGWLLGSNNAIDNLAISQEMFKVRELVREYLNCDDSIRRSKILSQLAEFESGTPNYLAPMIQQMNPVAAPDLTNYNGSQPIEFDVELPGPKVDPQPQRFRCLVHLPPEYDPYRRYPLLITLPGGRQTVDQNLDMWCGSFNSTLNVRMGQASRNGYIVLAIDWRLAGQASYEYSAREHATVTKALRMALRKFSVDADRVFLSGHGIGGNAAYDIGLSHPEHWAGVIGISGSMEKYLNIYDRNRQLGPPVYSVVGTKDIPTILANKEAWNTWLPSRNFVDCTVVMYDGRANELFAEEIPEIFKWTRAQRRRWPDKSGFSFECKTIRPWDCYFWFYEFDGIPVENVVWPEDWRDKGIRPMVISGETKTESPNTFRLGPSSSRFSSDSTLWLSPEFVNLDQEIQIKGRGKFKGPVRASSEVLLEDVRRRADREHPYWARIDCRNMEWTPNE
jgi:pimeloyl-ACP methyl ester carboxylesterase